MDIDTEWTWSPQAGPEPGGGGGREWLLFIHHLPPRPDYLRVKVRRRLAQCGAVLVKPSVYALPRTEETAEDLEWLRREIGEEGGEAIVCVTRMLSGLTDEALTALFVTERQQAYREVEEEAARTRAGAVSEGSARGAAIAGLNRLRRRLAETRGVDFFGAPGRAAAEQAVAALEAALFPAAHRAEGDMPVSSATGGVWVTRQGIKVDRIASGWLIRRFIDPAARFRFVDPSTYAHEAGQLRFDMYDGEYTHEGELCTFEKLLSAFSLRDAALRSIAEIVHDIDCKELAFDRPERAGVAALIDGIAAAHATDEARLEAGGALFDALYVALGGRPGAT